MMTGAAAGSSPIAPAVTATVPARVPEMTTVLVVVFRLTVIVSFAGDPTTTWTVRVVWLVAGSPDGSVTVTVAVTTPPGSGVNAKFGPFVGPAGVPPCTAHW